MRLDGCPGTSRGVCQDLPVVDIVSKPRICDLSPTTFTLEIEQLSFHTIGLREYCFPTHFEPSMLPDFRFN